MPRTNYSAPLMLRISCWRCNIRGSQTEPYLRLLIEATNGNLLSEKRTVIEAALKPFI